MTNPPELFSPERPIRSDFARQGGPSYAVRRIVTLVVLLGAMGGGGVWLWSHSSPSTPEEIPTVKADGTYKQRPDQPGGIDIPHQDVQVYHEIDGSAGAAAAKPEIEHMLPPPEEPNAASLTTAAPQIVTGADVKAPAQVERLTPTTVSPVPAAAPVPAPAPAPATAPSPIAASVSAVTANAPLALVPSPSVDATTVIQPVTKPTNPPAPVAAFPAPQAAALAKQPSPVAETKSKNLSAAGKGSTVVQLAALPDEQAAQAMAQKLQAKYAAILGPAHLHPVRANLGAKGIFYRIQSQALSEEQAKSICAAVKNLSAGCLLVHP